MAQIELKQQLKLTQQLILTPQLQLAIKLLQLPRLELIEMIRQELEENPVLEDVSELASEEPVGSMMEASGDDEEEDEKFISQTEIKGGKEIDWERYIENFSNAPVIPVYRQGSDNEFPSIEATASRQETLFDYLMWEIRLSNFSPEEERVAILIIGNLDEDGYFRQEKVRKGKKEENDRKEVMEGMGKAGQVDTVDKLSGRVVEGEKVGNVDDEVDLHSSLAAGEESEEVGRGGGLAELARDAGVSMELAENVLRKIQRLDPVGVASRSLEECLLVQAEVYSLNGVVREVIKKHLKNLQKKNYTAIAKDLKIPIEEVYDAVKKIASLEPKPARNYTGDPPQYIIPDVFVEKVGDEYVVRLNDDGMPRLRISSAYRRNIGDPAAKSYIKDRLRKADWLIKSIEQRKRTILRVTKCIVEKQREFMDKGPGYLKPMILHDVARELDLHDSTISRVTTGKYVHTPQGIYELKYFFNTGLMTRGDETVSSVAVKKRIKEIIEREDPSSPYSDQQIVSILARDGIIIARRTVAKYREGLGILPSGQRRHIT